MPRGIADTANKKQGSSGKQKALLFLCMLTSMFTAFMGSSLNLSVTDISSEFQSGATTITWVVNVFTITTAAFSVPFGHLGDISDKRKLFLLGVSIFCITSLIGGISNSVYLLIASRFVQAFGGAMIMGSNIPILLSIFPPERRGSVIGFNVTGVYVGLSLGPVVGGIMNNYLGWRFIFLVVFVLMLVIFAFAWKLVPAERNKVKAKNDIIGTLLFVLAVALLLTGLSLVSNVNGYPAWLIIAGIVFVVLFVIRELKAEVPILQVRLFARSASYTLSNLVALTNYGATFAITYMLSIFLQNAFGLPSALAGIILVAQPLVQAIFAPIAGRLSDTTVAPEILAAIGMALVTGGLFCLAFATRTTSVLLIVAILAVIGFGHGLFSTPNNSAVISCVDRKHVGEANAILSAMRSLGQSLSMVVVLAIIGMFVGNTVIDQAPVSTVVDCTHTAMLVCAFICLVGTGIAVVAAVKRHSKRVDVSSGA